MGEGVTDSAPNKPVGKSVRTATVSAILLMIIGGLVAVWPDLMGPPNRPFTDGISAFDSKNFDANGTVGYVSVLFGTRLTSPLGLLGAGEDISVHADFNYSLYPVPASPPEVTFYFHEVGGNHVSVDESLCQPTYRYCTFPKLDPVPGKPQELVIDNVVWFPVGGDYAWVLRFDYPGGWAYMEGNSTKRGEGFVTIEPRSVSLQVRSNWNQQVMNNRFLGLALIAIAGSLIPVADKLEEILSHDGTGKGPREGASTEVHPDAPVSEDERPPGSPP